MRNQVKGIAAVLCAAVVISSVPVYASEDAEGAISDGMFAWLTVQAYNAACSLNGGTENLWDNGIEGEATEEWILETAKDYAREYLAAEQKFDEMGLALRASERELIDSTRETYWNAVGYGRYYEGYGISEDDFDDVLSHEYKIDIMFSELEPELLEAVTDEDIYDYIEANTSLVQYIAVPYSDLLEIDATDEEIADWIDMDEIYDGYRDRIEQGEAMEDLVKEIAEDEELYEMGISSSYADGIEETLFLNSTTSLSSGFKSALADAKVGEVNYFDDAAESFQIIFVKLDFTEDWDGLDSVWDSIALLAAEEQFEAEMAEWGEAFTLTNENDLLSASEVKAMFS